MENSSTHTISRYITLQITERCIFLLQMYKRIYHNYLSYNYIFSSLQILHQFQKE